MKNCPFCKALIEDNARFCIYCMSPLDEKQEITPKKSQKSNIRYIALAAAAVIIIAAAVGAFFAFMPKSQSDNNTAQTTSNIAITTSTTAVSISGEDNSSEQSIATEIVTDANGGKIIVNAENGKPIEINSGGKTITQPQQTANNVPSGTTAVSSKSTTAANTAAPQKITTKMATKAQTTKADNVTYTYRAAKYGDDYSVSYPTDNCVVITGVTAKSSSG
ncbi:MAG: hypothetical protein ACI396_05255, partial [Acutalibacteraceae bacterium]